MIKKEDVLFALKSHGYSVLKSKKIFKVMESNSLFLQSVEFKVGEIREVALWSVEHRGYTLRDLNVEFKGDYEIVMAAVIKSGGSLRLASKELKANKEIVLNAVKNYGYAIQYGNKRLRNNKEVAIAAVSNIGAALEFVSDTLKNDKDVVLAALLSVKKDDGGIEDTETIFKFASEDLRSIVGGQDPLEVLPVLLETEKLSNSVKESVSVRKKIKV